MNIAFNLNGDKNPFLIFWTKRTNIDKARSKNKSIYINNLKNKNSIKKIAKIEISIFENGQNEEEFEINIKDYSKSSKDPFSESENKFEYWIQNNSNMAKTKLKSMKKRDVVNTPHVNQNVGHIPPLKQVSGNSLHISNHPQELGGHFKNLNLKDQKFKVNLDYQNNRFFNEKIKMSKTNINNIGLKQKGIIILILFLLFRKFHIFL